MHSNYLPRPNPSMQHTPFIGCPHTTGQAPSASFPRLPINPPTAKPHPQSHPITRNPCPYPLCSPGTTPLPLPNPTPIHPCPPPELGCTPDLTPCCFSNSTASCPTCPANSTSASPLYGCKGERFEAGKSRLPYDWSYAGYGWGEMAVPTNLTVAADVKKTYGAVGGEVWGLDEGSSLTLVGVVKLAAGY